MNKIKDRIGTTLLEIIVAMLILSLVMYGLLSLFVASKQLVYHSGSRVTSMEMGKYFFEDANLTVSAANFTVNQNCLYNNASCVAVTRTINNIQYNITYRTAPVFNATGAEVLRKVVIDVEWAEPK